MNAIIGTGNKRVSKREYEVIGERNISVPMSDGVAINVDIFRPAVPRRKFPALVGLSPFNLELQQDRIWPSAARSMRVRGIPVANVEAGPTDFFVRRGYMHVIGNVRGTGRSGGVYRYMDPKQIEDACELVEWVAQQPWCDGNVGMMGIAYFAALMPGVAALQPPHLKCIAPMFAFWDEYRYSWWTGGIFSSGFAKWFGSLVNLDIHTEAIVLREELGKEGFKKAITPALQDKDICADPELVDILQHPDAPGSSAVIDLLLHPTWCKFWEDRAVLDFDKIKVPSYFGVAAHRPGALYHWPNLKFPKKLIGVPPAYVDRPFYQCSWELLRWYDYWLKGMDTGIMDEPAVKVFMSGANQWKMGDDYPFPETKWIPFYLHYNNHMLCEMEPWPDALSYSYTDAPADRGFLKYYSAPLVEETEVVGPIVLNLYASCRGTDMNFFVSLWDADTSGNETCVTRGWLKASHRELDEKKSKPWHPVHQHINPRPVVPGQVYEFNIGLFPAAHLFKAGHCIVLKISSSDDPPRTQFEVGMTHLVNQTPNTITIHHNAQYPSHLLLPITKGNIVGTYVSGGDINLEKGFMELK